MFKICLQNRIVRQKHGTKQSYKCYICHLQISDEFKAVEEHITSEKHSGRIDQIDESSKEDESEILCSISEWKRKKLVENCVTCGAELDTFICHICKYEITELSQTLEHIKNTTHIDNLAQKQTEKLSILTTKHEPQKTNKISHSKSIPPLMSLQSSLDKHVSLISQDLYSCEICNCRISGVANTLSHINGNPHKSKAQANSTAKKDTDDGSSSIQEIHTSQVEFKYIITDIRYCNPCKVFLKDALMMQCHVMQHLHEEIDFPDQIDILQFQSKASSKSGVTCLLCAFHSSTSIKLYYHLKSQKHFDHLKLFFHEKEDTTAKSPFSFTIYEEHLKYLPRENVIPAFFCNVCNVPITGKTNVDQHKNGKKHKDSVLKYSKTDAELSDSLSHNVDFSSVYSCFICDSSFCTLQLLLKHYNSPHHMNKMMYFGKITLESVMSISIYNREPLIHCKSCDDKFPTLRAAVGHLSEEKHTSNLRLPATSQDSKVALSNHTAKSSIIGESSRQSMSELTLKITYESDTGMEANYDELGIFSLGKNEVSLGPSKRDQGELPLNNSQKKKLTLDNQTEVSQMSILTPKYTFSPENIPLFGDAFMDSCIKQGEMNIYNSNTELIRLLSNGVTLTLAYNSGRYCFPCQIVLQGDPLSLYEHLQSHIHIVNFNNMELEDKKYDKHKNYFSSLRLARLLMKKESDGLVTCCTCNMVIKNDYDYIFSHYKSAVHIKKSLFHRKETKVLLEKFLIILKEAWYHAESFACKICEKEYDSELNFVEHLQELQHIRNKNKCDQMQTLFNLCPVCSKYWFGNFNSYTLHCNDERHKILVGKTSDLIFESEKLDNSGQLFKDVDGLIQSLVIESDMANLDKNKELEILRTIEDTVRKSYPKARSYIFGSRISCLGTPDSDIQIFLDCDQNYLSSCSKKEILSHFSTVYRDFASESSVWTVSKIISQLPMIKLLHEPTNSGCKIYFSSGLDVEKSKLIGFYNTACSLCRHLILYLEEWLRYFRCSSGSDYTATLAISWCVIFYLQVQGILPSVHELLRHCKDSKIIDGWECGYSKLTPSVSSNLNFRDHLSGFFSYYSKFDYQTSVACPFLGRVIQKYDFAYTDNLPEEMEIYKLRASANFFEIFQFASPMCIQDPINLSQNLTQSVTKFELRRFRKYCMDSFKILTSKIE